MIPHVSGIGYKEKNGEPGNFYMQKCTGTGGWYSKRIGRVYDALPFSDSFFRIDNPSNCGYFFVHVQDCAVVEPELATL